MIPHKQLLADFFDDCQINDTINMSSFEIFTTIDLDEIVPASFYFHFRNSSTGRPRKYKLYPSALGPVR